MSSDVFDLHCVPSSSLSERSGGCICSRRRCAALYVVPLD